MMRMRHLLLSFLVAIIVFALAWGTAAEGIPSAERSTPTPTSTPDWSTLWLQQGVNGYTGCTDTWLDAWDTEETHGTDALMNVRSTNHQVALIRFDLEGIIPAGARIIEATLYLYAVDRTNPAAITVETYQTYRHWSEAEANWHKATLTDLWDVPGCGGPNTDRAAEMESTQEVTGAGVWAEWDVSEMVQAWVADPTANKGINLRGSGSVSMRLRFATADHWRTTWRPRLKIIWTRRGAPEPTYTPYPTYTPFPTYTPWPTSTPTATPTPTPPPKYLYAPLIYMSERIIPPWW